MPYSETGGEELTPEEDAALEAQIEAAARVSAFTFHKANILKIILK